MPLSVPPFGRMGDIAPRKPSPPSQNNGDENDTWEWDGKDWTELKPKTIPPARSGHMMVFDEKNDLVHIPVFANHLSVKYVDFGYLGTTIL